MSDESPVRNDAGLRAREGAGAPPSVPPPTSPVSGVRAESAVADEPASTMRTIQTYEELVGGQGREVYFRPERYAAAELGSVRPVISVGLGAEGAFECDLYDVSQNGVAFEWLTGPRMHVGLVIPDLAVSFDGYAAYRGAATVGSVRDVGGRTIVGASFLDSLMNIDDVLQLRDVKAWSAGEGAAGLGLSARSWFVEGHHRFKGLLTDLRLYLEDAQQLLGRLEASLPWHVAHGEPSSPAREALVARIRAELVPAVVRASEDLDAALREVPPAEVAALKEISQRELHPILMQAPWLRRAADKPLGYPGDYEVMRYMYERPFEGPTLFAKALHLAFLQTRGALAVPARKDLMKREIAALVRARGDEGRPTRILSIAAGPAQETYEMLREIEAPRAPVEIVLFDQDKRALAYAYGRVNAVVKNRALDNVRVVYLHDSIRRLLVDPTIFDRFGKFDMLFSCGLFDYLRIPKATALTRNFYENLAPGGRTYIGNMVPENPCRWYIEMHLDWYLTHKTREEMRAMASAAAPDARVETLEESTGINPFVVLTRA